MNELKIVSVIAVDREEYEALLMLKGRVAAFAEYVRQEKFSISKEQCAAMIGFDLDAEGYQYDQF